MKTYEKLTHMLPESFIVASSISKRNCNGLFTMPRKYSGTNYQTTGVWNTNFANAMDIELNCKKFTLFELLEFIIKYIPTPKAITNIAIINAITFLFIFNHVPFFKITLVGKELNFGKANFI